MTGINTNDDLTKREKDTLNFICLFMTVHGYSPSIREIMEGIHTKSYNQVDMILLNLVNKGYIKNTEKVSRSIVLLRRIKDESSRTFES